MTRTDLIRFPIAEFSAWCCDELHGMFLDETRLFHGLCQVGASFRNVLAARFLESIEPEAINVIGRQRRSRRAHGTGAEKGPCRSWKGP